MYLLRPRLPDGGEGPDGDRLCRLSVYGWPVRRRPQRSRVANPSVSNPSRRRLPAGTPRARDRYRAAGLCVRCGAERDRPGRLYCRRCRRLHAEAEARYRAAHPLDRPRLYAKVRARRRRYVAAGLCSECGAERDRADRRLCRRCRARAAEKTAAYRARRGPRSATCGAPRRTGRPDLTGGRLQTDMVTDTTPAIELTEDATGEWKIELRNFPKIEEALGRDVLGAFCRCFVHSDRLTSLISCIHASGELRGRDSTAHTRDHLSMIWFTIGTLRELGCAIGAANDALYKRGWLEPESAHWVVLRELRRRWNKKKLVDIRNKAAFHVDRPLIDKGLDELVKHDVVELGKGQGEKNVDSTLSLGDLALLHGLELDPDEFRALAEAVRVDHAAAAEAVQLAFCDAAEAAGVSVWLSPAVQP